MLRATRSMLLALLFAAFIVPVFAVAGEVLPSSSSRVIGATGGLSASADTGGQATRGTRASTGLTHEPGETLYNGIVMPDVWPPKIDKLTREPMPVPYLEKRPEVVPIDVGRQLFVDDFLIESTTLKRTYHQATLHPANPVLQPDSIRRWEGSSGGKPCSMVFSDGVWFDPAENLFKMWYMGGYTRSVCYATSKDGIAWDKPTLDVVRGTNIVLDQNRDSTLIWPDPQDKDANRRYKMLVVTQCRDGRNGAFISIRYSADGIHWGPSLIEKWVGGDRSSFFYNPFRGKWVHSIRHDDKQIGRARMYAECTDLVEGLQQLDKIGRLWTNADKLDQRNPNPKLSHIHPELYNLDAVAYESVMLGLFSIWQGDPSHALKLPKDKRNEIMLGFSRDGFHWHRPDRRPFVGVNESPGAWNWGNVQSAGGCCLVVGDQLYFYVSGRSEDRAKGPATTGLAVLRRDGFASMDADERSGTLTTRLVTFKGKHLFVNADVARSGELRVEVLDREGKVVAGLGMDDCLPVVTDSTLAAVRWKGGGDLGTLAGQPVRFRFHLNRGKLYAFWVSPEQSGASHGYVAAGGPGYTGPSDTVGLAARPAAVAMAIAQQCITTPPPKDAVVLFDGSTSSNWGTRENKPSPWEIAEGVMVASNTDIVTKQKFGDYQLHVEFRIPNPSPPDRKGNGNSGVYLHGHYELQVLDRPDHISRYGCGAIYEQAAPLVDATFPAMQWQSYDVFFQGPRLDAKGNIIKKARISVIHNGLWIHHDREIDTTPGGLESAVKSTGPIMLQYHNYAVAYRNIWIRPLIPETAPSE